jgi:hypothetical protein
VAVSAIVMPTCRLHHSAAADVSRLDDSSTQVVVRVGASSNARYRIVATAIGRAGDGPPGDQGATWRVLVRNAAGEFVALGREEPVAIATLHDPGVREHAITYRLIEPARPNVATPAEPRVGVACVVDQPGVATGVVLEL